MKTYIAFILALLFGFQTAFSQKDKFTVKVDGLGCPFCAYGLEKKFKDVDGIAKIAIDIETGVLTYETPAEQAMTLAQVEERVQAAGYTLKHAQVVRSTGTTEQTEVVAQQEVTEGMAEKSIMVKGSCDMCKARIEKAALGVKGVSKAEWSADNQMLKVAFDAAQTNLASVQTAVVKSGHDAAGAKANNKTYNSLPGCCQYR